MPNIIMADQPSGGQEITLLASGTYTQSTESTNSMVIPVSYTGTPLLVLVEADTPVSGVNQTYQWAFALNDILPADLKSYFEQIVSSKTVTSGGAVIMGYPLLASISNSQIEVRQNSNNYQIKANTYNWKIWGYAT